MSILLKDLPEEIQNNLEQYLYTPRQKHRQTKDAKYSIKEYFSKPSFLLVCKYCNNKFFSIGENSKYCSQKCSYNSRIGIKRPEHSIKMKGKPGLHRFGKENPFYGKTHKDGSGHWKGGNKKYNICIYEICKEWDLTGIEVRKSEISNLLEVKCKYCNKWFSPSYKYLRNILSRDDRNLYCSEECKHACPIYNQKKYPKGFDEGSSREVQPELRKLVLERDNYTCQKCGLSSNNSCVELHCHHIDPVKANPIESADMDNCITLCKDCHLEAHQKDGCKTGQLATC